MTTNMSPEEYFEYVCKDEEVKKMYEKAVAGLEERVDELETDYDALHFEHENLAEQHIKSDELCNSFIALMFELEKCRSVKQVRELINQHRMDRYADSL